MLGSPGADRGGYVDLDSNGHWWIPSGRMFLSPGSPDTSAEELLHARQHFFLPHRYRDPFHTDSLRTESFVSYDDYDLLMLETCDALGNRVTVGERSAANTIDSNQPGNDYRVLQPRLITDPNRNRVKAAFDILGMVAGTAVMGKDDTVGDMLEGFESDLTPAQIDDFFDSNPHLSAPNLLNGATTRIVYDIDRFMRTQRAHPEDLTQWLPVCAATLARETHVSDPVPPQGLKIQIGFSYSDGFGREIQKKFQAEPGPVPERDANGKIIVGPDGRPKMTLNDISSRWIGSGWTLFNNKGKPVRQFEPFFSDTHRFEFDVRIGVSPVLFYDPVERVVATLHPNHTWEKVVFDPWRQETWDVSDTVLVADPKTDPHVGDFFRRLSETDYLPPWHGTRHAGALGVHEQDAARKAAVHFDTPAVSHADSLGRTFLTIAHNKFKYSNTPPADPPIEQFYETRVIFDIEGNQREAIDAKDRIVIRYNYDMLGNRIHQASMEAGERWMLNDVAGNSLYAWDSRGHQLRTEFDLLRRPTKSFLNEGLAAEQLVGRTVYGETRPNPETNNLRGKVVQLFDQAGVVTNDEFDFKGNLLHCQRQLARKYNTTLNWSVAVPLDGTIFTSRTRYDALNRPTELVPPHNPTTQPSIIRPSYNEANLLERVEANLRGAQLNGQPVWTPFVTDIDYDAKGQRTLIQYGNGVRTRYEYDPLTFRLTHLLTQRNATVFPDDSPEPPPVGFPGSAIQNLQYTYDPVGNITHIGDDAQQTIFFRNKRVEPSADYTYDAISRLIEATGREHLGQGGAAPSPSSYNDKPRVGILLSASDGAAMGRYLERYIYDAAGNFQEMVHLGSDPVQDGWTRAYLYNEPSQLEPGKPSNRLSSTAIGAMIETYSTGGEGYDRHGNMLRMPHLQVMQWDFLDQLQMTQRQAVNADDEDGLLHQGERTWYVYDPSGQRVRKVTERQAPAGQTPMRMKERIYLGGFEIYREYENDGDTVTLERETLHIMDDAQRIALVEMRTHGDDGTPRQLIRFQFGNHLGSVSLELDGEAQVISYEEYTPYGSSSYQARRSASELSLKRYKYTEKERDEETGFSYHGARYYTPWLGRWVSADPGGLTDGVNLYLYVGANPTAFIDPTGNDRRSPSIAQMKRRLKEINEEIAKNEAIVAHYDAVEAKARANLAEKRAAYAEIQKKLAVARADLAVKRDAAERAKQVAREAAERAKESSSKATRAGGGLKVLGGGAGFAGGAALCATIIGCLIGGPLMLASSDVAGSGVSELATGDRQPTFIGQIAGPEAQSVQEDVVNAAGVAHMFTPAFKPPYTPSFNPPKPQPKALTAGRNIADPPPEGRLVVGGVRGSKYSPEPRAGEVTMNPGKGTNADYPMNIQEAPPALNAKFPEVYFENVPPTPVPTAGSMLNVRALEAARRLLAPGGHVRIQTSPEFSNLVEGMIANAGGVITSVGEYTNAAGRVVKEYLLHF
jgi:RHS repeat-associated protein